MARKLSLRMRLFIAIPLGAEVCSELSRTVARLKPASEGWRWSPPEGWHITLQFLGATSPEQHAAVVSRLREIRSSPIPMQLGNLDLFDRAGVFFADVLVSAELLALQQKVVAATTPCAFVAETRPYHPHTTLARLKGSSRGPNLRALRANIAGQPRFSNFIADAFLLYESFPEPAGSRYEVRGAFPLA